MMAVAPLDGCNYIFPIAFVIVDLENDLSWQLFFAYKIRICNSLTYFIVTIMKID